MALRRPATDADEFVVRQFKAYQKNTLMAFLSLELPGGLVLHGFTLHQKNGSRWLGVPSKEFTKADGVRSWVPQIEFVDKAARDKFQSAALAAVDDYLATEEL
jgi:hypothetical protein